MVLVLPAAAQRRDRASIPEEYKWDLTHIYPSDAAWRAAKDTLCSDNRNYRFQLHDLIMRTIDRRSFLTSALAMGVSASFSQAVDAAQQRAAAGNPRRIDMHHHFAPPAWVADVKGRPLLQPANTRWTPEQSIEDMDRGGVAAAVVSITNPGLWFGDHGPVTPSCARV